MNDDNLKGHGFNERSAEEVRALQAKGGRNSGKTRRRKADLRKAIQAALSSTYNVGENGESMTGEEIFVKALMSTMSKPNSKNWSKAIDTIVKLADVETAIKRVEKEKEALEMEKLRAEAELAKAKAAQINASGAGTDIEDLSPLTEMLRLEQNAND